MTITLTDDELKRLRSRATEERRTAENMATSLVVRALRPRTAPKRKPATRKAKA